MGLDDSEHSESEFYYPEEADIPTTRPLKTESLFANSHHTQQCMSDSDVQQYIESQQPKNTTKKTDVMKWR